MRDIYNMPYICFSLPPHHLRLSDLSLRSLVDLGIVADELELRGEPKRGQLKEREREQGDQ